MPPTIPISATTRPTRALPAHGAHDRHAGHSVAMFRDRFWLSLLLTIPVIVWSTDPQEWLGYTAPAFPGSAWIPPILGTIVFVYGGIPFLRGAVDELRDRTPGMMTLISLAILVAFVTSWASTLGWLDVEIWWELATLITIMLLGHWLEMRSIAQARGALAALAELLPDTAERVTADGTETVAVADLRVGDVVLVRPGGRVPVDGEVVDGAADVDESLITGESRPVPKEAGAAVIAGSVVAGGSLRVGSRPSASRRRCRGSFAWSRRRRPRSRVPRHWAIARPRSCSTWHSSRAWPRSSGGCCSAIPRVPSSAPRPCS